MKTNTIMRYFCNIFNLINELKNKKMKTKLDYIFNKIDAEIRNTNLYLQPDLNIKYLAKNLGFNRTYVSQAINSQKLHFTDYINNYRIVYLKKYLRKYTYNEIIRLDQEALSSICGFKNKRNMNDALKRKLNYNFVDLTRLHYWDD